MSDKSEIYWKTKAKYAVMTTVITFFIGGIFAIIFNMLFPPTITLDGFITLGFFSIAVLWVGILLGRYLIRFGIIQNPK